MVRSRLLCRSQSEDTGSIAIMSNHKEDCVAASNSNPELTLPSVCPKRCTRRQPALTLDESIRRWHVKCEIMNSLPFIKDQNDNETGHQISGKDTRSQLSHTWSQLHLYHRTFNNIPTNPKHDPVKERILRRSVATRLKNGSTVGELVKEPFFEDVLDICEKNCYFPAQKKGMEMTLENWRALRNCKYLRLSDTNIRSLKESTLRSFGE